MKITLATFGLAVFCAAPFALQAGTGVETNPRVCTEATLADYIALNDTNGPGCSIGFVNFDHFDFTSIQGSYSSSDILVDPAVFGFTFSRVGNPQLPFFGPAHFQIYYDFQIDPAPVLDGAELFLDPPSGDVDITQYYCLDGTFTFGQNSDGFPTIGCSSDIRGALNTLHVNVPNPRDVEQFASTTQGGASVLTDILIGENSQFDQIQGNASITGVPDAPEPVSSALALVGMGLIVWKKKKTKSPA